MFLRQVVLEKLRHVRGMLFPNVEILECRRERFNHQFITRSKVFVEAPNRNARFLHHIGDADTFKSALAKPLGGNLYNALMRGLLVLLGMPHIESLAIS